MFFFGIVTQIICNHFNPLYENRYILLLYALIQKAKRFFYVIN